MRHTAAVMILLLLAACARVVPPAPRITMSPAPDTVSAPTEHGLTVTADGGRLTSVLAYAGRDLVPGSFDASRTRWRSSRALTPGTEYVVNAVAAGQDGVAAQVDGRFETRR
ncbi:Ig-like domain-containing protein [Planotetraspora kaengkrachanensis]|uniref:Bacterial Ig domain-containing protein n=1 Tax=Planotetraspora kaengkrachanensis TaxID=575193 RepID=A0A8J3V7D3_9ACTN|nr:Ig-like domain-containing protein [Planotetraspora kaengkrachanensis]GIG81298.1 hypothetical protein Pka01_44250 [Planotetraspora kaengkrachanensis]